MNNFKRVKAAGGKVVEQPQEIAIAFNDYFGNIGSALAANIPEKPHKIHSKRSYALLH